ncbi:MAG: hypothetical protein FWE02_05075 [Defluviitaleaceae bacterium]|nr:hypothetical protein [Defluviitaleaceae bacterium]
MGMTDRQFDIFLKSHLILLKKAFEEQKASGNTEILEKIIKDFEESLKRP